MKKYIPLILGLIFCSTSYAQPWMKEKNGPVKYMDAVAAYEREEVDEKRDHEEFGEAVREDENYHFDRWCWYWKQHLDTAGYIVGTAKARQNWLSFLGSSNTAAKTTAAANWIFQGPDHSNGGYSGLGRINAVGFDPVDANTLYVGSAAGSTWKTTDGGSTWTCLYDIMGTLSVSDIKVNPQNRNTVYVATGDANGNDDYSIGIIKSYDGGANWTVMGPPWTVDSFRIVTNILVNPIDTNKLVIGSSAGVYKSDDGGASWARVYTGGIKQILYSPNDTAVLYATTRSFSNNAQIIKSTDGGYTWTTVTAFSGASRICIAVTPAAPNVVKAIAANNNSGLKGIYTSSDYGNTFTATFSDDASCSNNMLSYDLGLPSTACNGQAWYDLCIAVDPLDADNVIIGGINNYYSTDGGYSWEIANQWYNGVAGLQVVHADKHWLGYNPLSNILYLGCDGGIYRTNSPLWGLWVDITDGIGITQFYRNAVDNGVTFCLGGAQDNGTKMVNGSTAADMTGGDGMQCLINYENPADIFYCATQNGYVQVTYNGGASFTTITDDLPTPGAWITPYVLHPSNATTLFIGYKQVFRSDDNGGSWLPISPVFNSTTNIQILKVSVADPNYIYAVRENGPTSRIHYTTNGGTTWNMMSSAFTNSISDLEIDPENAEHIWVTISGYAPGKVYGYNLTGGTWTDESAGLPNLPVNCMITDTFSQTRYVGTDAAVFYRTTDMTSWALYNAHLPSVQVYDLNINYATNEIWAATYGRGMWKSQKLEIPTGIATHASLADVVSVVPNPCHNNFTLSATGLSFRNAAVSVRISSADGRTVYNTKGTFDYSGKLKVVTNDLAPGFYICEVSNNKAMARTSLMMY